MNTQNKLFEKLCTEDALYEAWKVIKSKKAGGGIDGVTISLYEENIQENLKELLDELKSGTWEPEPYLSVSIPKKNNEQRKLGLLSVKDKIVQHAIKSLIEPMLENMFVDQSYAYRPNKGHAKAIRRVQSECAKKKNKWVLRLDIDDYFDNICHNQLAAQLHKLFPEEDEMVRLIMLSVEMGLVNKRLKWDDRFAGVPQGAILSPLLSNLYLNSFDKYVLTLNRSYIRYADDFCLLCESKDEANKMRSDIAVYLQTKLGLKLNTPVISDLHNGFEFLGITISKSGLRLSKEKEADLMERIDNMKIENKRLSEKSLTAWKGVCCYYGVLLPQDILRKFDDHLYDRIKLLITESYKEITNRGVLGRMLSEVEYLSNEYQIHKKRVTQDYISIYDNLRCTEKEIRRKEMNKLIIERRKREYRKLEGEGKELLVNSFGCYIGLTKGGVTVKQNGKLITSRPLHQLSHITITGKGVSLSTNIIDYCLANKISIDFFNSSGTHTGSVLSNKYMESTLWNKQATCSPVRRINLATMIIDAKLRNQLHLVKYFHKYHKTCFDNLADRHDELESFYNRFKTMIKAKSKDDDDFIATLVAHEAQGAIKYWAYIRELLKDDNVGFEKREHKGATDLVNCMLNYGYSILYSRVWQALLVAKLNPFDSIIHVRQAGKPTFVYDVVEMFRSQVVDRVVVSLVQKGHQLGLKNNLLTDDTKKILAAGILDRLNRYEKYRGEEISMEQIIRRQTCDIANWLDNEKTYKPYIAKW
jgi:group II intron reverse transcriptase/maturase/CRISPR-associated endonuclease Cas1